MIKYKKTIRVSSTGDYVAGSVLRSGSYKTKEISTIIEKEVGIPTVRNMSALSAATEIMRRLLMDGESVTLDGLGNFKASVTFNGETPVASRIVFTPCIELREEMKAVSLAEVTV